MIIYGGAFIYGEKLSVYSSPANFKLKRKIIFWIKHLFLCYHLADKNPESYWIGLNLKKKSVLKRKLKFVPQAEEYLTDLIALYKKGLEQPLAFDASILELKQGKQSSTHISFQKKTLRNDYLWRKFKTFIYGEKLSVYSSPANFKLKRKIIFWIKHLFLCYHLADKNPESYWIGLNLKICL